MTGKRFSKNMIRRLAMSGGVANAYALGRTMQEKHNHAVNASAVQIYGDGTRLHTLKSGLYRRLYATGGGGDLMPQIAHVSSPWSFRLLVDTNKQCWRLGTDGAGGTDTTWQKVLPGIKIKAIRAEEQRVILLLTEEGVLYGMGGSNVAAPMVSEQASNADIFPPQQITPFADWEVIATRDRYVAVGIRKNGTLWAWGGPDQLWKAFVGPVAVSVPHTEPMQLSAATDWLFVEMGSHAIYAVKKDGSVWFAGLRYYDGSFTHFTAGFEQITTITKKQITEFFSSWPGKHPVGLGQMYTRLVLKGAQLQAFGQLSGGGTVQDHVMTNVAVASILSYEWPGFAILGPSPILWAQSNKGDIIGLSNSLPVTVEVYSGPWIFFSSYFDSRLGIKKDGTLWAWGNNHEHRLGAGILGTYSTPTQVGNRNKKTGEIEFLSDWEWVHVGRFTAAKSRRHGIFFCGNMWLNEDFRSVAFPYLTPFDPDTPEWTTNPDYRMVV